MKDSFLKGKNYDIAKIVNEKDFCQIDLCRKDEKKKLQS